MRRLIVCGVFALDHRGDNARTRIGYKRVFTLALRGLSAANVHTHALARPFTCAAQIVLAEIE